MMKNKAKPQDKKPFTAEELFEYLKQFDKNSVINMTVVTQRGKQIFGYPVKKFTIFTDVTEPHILVEIGQAVKVERSAQRIKRQQEEKRSGS